MGEDCGDLPVGEPQGFGLFGLFGFRVLGLEGFSDCFMRNSVDSIGLYGYKDLTRVIEAFVWDLRIL